MAQSVWSPGLQDAVEDAARYDWLVAMPYLFGTTYWAAAARPERTALIPCVHDEAARLDARWCARCSAARPGCMLNSHGEGELLARLAPDAEARLVSVGYDDGDPARRGGGRRRSARARGIAPGLRPVRGAARGRRRACPTLFAAYAELVARRPTPRPWR